MRGLPDVIARSYLRKFAVVTLLTLVLVGGTAVYSLDQASTHLQEETHAELSSLASVEADRLAGWVEDNRQNARLISSMKDFQGYSDSRVNRRLDTELANLPTSTQAIHHVDLKTNTVMQSTSHDDGTTLDYIEWRETEGWTGLSNSAAAEAGLAFGGPDDTVMSSGFEHEGETRIAFASKVPGRQSAIVVVVDAAVRAAQFESSMEGSVTDTIASDGTVMLSTAAGNTLDPYAAGTDSAAFTRATRGKTGALDDDADEVVRAYAPIQGTDWVVVLSAPQSEAYALQSAIQRDLLLVGGVAFLGLLFVGLTIGRSTARSLDSLATEASAVARGDLDVEISGTARRDEVGRVSRSFAAVQSSLGTAARQADAIADRRFDDPALDEDVPGDFGATLDAMATDVETLIDDVEAARESAEATNRALERRAAAYSTTMAAAADGDLTQRLDADADSRAMAEVATAYNEMLDAVEATVSEVQRVTSRVAASTQSAGVGADEVESAGEEVATATQEISDAVVEQTSHLQEVRAEMASLSATVEEVAATASEVAAHSEAAADRGREGAALADDALVELATIERRSVETAETVERLEGEIDRIDHVVEVIDGIAEQTNVLALNASIEAARAGAAGDGFAVVAEEVKDLAMETREATGEIADRIDGVQSTTETAVGEMATMREEVETGARTVESGLTALDDVVEAVETANDEVQSISAAADQQAASAEEVVAMADEATDLGDRVADDTHAASAAAQQQAAALAQVSDEVRSVARRATDLRELTDAFETRGGEDAPSTDESVASEAEVPKTTTRASTPVDVESRAVASSERPSTHETPTPMGDGGFVTKTPRTRRRR